MRRLWVASSVLVGLACLITLLTGCAQTEESSKSVLEAYRPALKAWTVEEEAVWELYPRYEISATLNADAMSLDGYERVHFTNREKTPLRDIRFRLYPYLLEPGGELTVQSVASNGIPVDYESAAAGTGIRVLCDPPLQPGQVAVLDIRFTTQIPDVADGYVLFGRSQNIISLPDFYPLLEVRDAQGWHEEMPAAFGDVGFAESAFYRVSFTAGPEYVLAATGKMVSQTTQPDGSVTTEFVAGPIREFVVMASPDYEVEATEAYGTTIRSYFLPADRDAGMSALWRAASAIRVYSDLYGPYPYTEMNVVEAPLTYRGMEYPTLNLLGVETYSIHRSDLDYLTIHEVAHQWWYGMVGNDPITYPWLDEGLAEYSAYVYYWKVFGREAADRLCDVRWSGPYEYTRDSGADTVLAQPATAFVTSTSYETIVYAKGALFFDALRRSLGDDVYFTILQEYVRRYRFQIVKPEQFFLLAQEVSERDLTPLIQQWILSAES